MSSAVVPASSKPQGLKPHSKCKRYLASAHTKFLVLTLTLFLYTLIAAAIIQVIEGDDEQVVRQQQQQLLNLNSTNYTAAEVMAIVEQVVIAAKKGIIEVPGLQTRTIWSNTGSFYFIFTVVTTIGYGNIAPATYTGKAFVCLIGFLGIPFTMVILSKMGAHISDVANYIFIHPDSSTCYKRFVATTMLIFVFLIFFIVPAAVFTQTEQWDYRDGLYYSFVTLSTIGFGDLVAAAQPSQVEPYKLGLIAWVFIGLAMISMLFSHIEDVISGTKTDDKDVQTDNLY